jgi:hypothetical protein
MTTQQIEVLARFDGWEKYTSEKYGERYKHQKSKHPERMGSRDVKQMAKHLTSPGVLIEMRLKVLKQLEKMEGMYGEEVKFNEEVTNLILNKEYTAAAINISEIIQKLEA